MTTKRKLSDEIVRLQYRVKELEERLCPCGQHDLVQTGVRYRTTSYGDCDAIVKFKCKRCGVETEKYDFEVD